MAALRSDSPASESAAGGRRLALRQVAGYACILGTITAWVVQSELLQCLQTGKCFHTAHNAFNRPFSMTWWNHSCLALLLPLEALHRRLTAPHPHAPTPWLCPALRQAGLSHRRCVAHVLPLAGLYLAADYCWYLALPYSTVFVATTIMSSNGAFVYLLAVPLLGERMSFAKAQALLIALAGIFVIAAMAPKVPLAQLHTHTHVHETLFGDLSAALAAVLYAGYEVCFARHLCVSLRVSSAAGICALSGYIGLSTFLLLWPGILVAHLIPKEYTLYHEHLRLPIQEEYMAMAIGGGLTLCFNGMILLSVALTSPLKTNVGCMLMVPMSALVDWLWRGAALSPADLCGGALIVGGFVLLVQSP